MRAVGKLAISVAGALLLASSAPAVVPAQAQVEWGGHLESSITATLEESGEGLRLDDPRPVQKLTLSVDVPAAAGKAYAWAQGTALLAWPDATAAAPEASFRLDEAYVELYTDRVDYRVGLQEVRWGSAYEVNPTSFVSRTNLLDPLTDPPAVWAARATAYWGDTSLDLIWLPQADVVPAGQVPAELTSNPFDPEGEAMEIVPPAAGWQDGELAFALTRRALGPVDLALSYFRGKEDLPRHADYAANETTYDDVQRYGIDLSGDLGGFGVWAEAAYSEPAARQGVNVEMAAGADYRTRKGTYLASQLLYTLDTQRIEAAGGTPSLADGQSYLMVVTEAEPAHATTLNLATVYGLDSGAAYGLAALDREVAPGTHLELSASTTLAGGGRDRLLDALPDTLTLSLRVEF